MASANVEIQFAQRLAANEKRIRDKALKKLRKYINSRCSTKEGVTSEDLIKLWKGLHYCMWMQDKPLLQEELAVHIARLVFSFPTSQSAMLFFTVFLETEAREWNGIDRLRLDKFMLLVRQMLNQMFVMLKQDGWTSEGTERLLSVLRETILNPTSEGVPDSLGMHLADIYLTELAKVGWEQLDGSQVLEFLKVFDEYLRLGNRFSVLKRIFVSVFGTIIQQTRERVEREAKKKDDMDDCDKDDDEDDDDSGYDEDSEPRLKFDCQMIADHLFQLGSQEKCHCSNRQQLYRTVKRLRDAASGTPLGDRQKDEYDLEADMEDAVMRLESLQPKKGKKKRKLVSSEVDESESTEGEKSNKKRKIVEPEEEAELVIKKKKKKKKKNIGTAPVNKADNSVSVDNSEIKSRDGSPETTAKTKNQLKHQKAKSDGVDSVQTDCKSGKSKKQSEKLGKSSPKSSKVVGTLKTKGDGKDKSGAKFDQSLDDGEVEIWVPNKKYKVNDTNTVMTPNQVKSKKVKGKNVKVNKDSVDDDNEIGIGGQSDTTGSPPFAKFTTSSPPSAFVRRAMTKVAKTPDKKQNDWMNKATPELTASEKKVKFNMKKNRAQRFEDSINVSPLPAFNPYKSPVQGILKASPSPSPAFRAKKKRRKSGSPRQSSGKKQTKTSPRSKASDFF